MVTSNYTMRGKIVEKVLCTVNKHNICIACNTHSTNHYYWKNWSFGSL